MFATIDHTTHPVLIQDQGRFHYNHIGVSTSGAADMSSYMLAQRLLANPYNAGAWEITFGNLTFSCDEDTFIACTGAPAPITLNHTSITMNTRTFVPANTFVHIGLPSMGIKTYLAFRGRIDIEPVFYSLSTDTLSHIGPQPLVNGSRCPITPAHYDLPATIFSPYPFNIFTTLTYTPLLLEHGFSSLIPDTWTMSPLSNRIGARLLPTTSYKLPTTFPYSAEATSIPMFKGALELTPSGQVIAFLADHPTTGGYCRFGALSSESCDSLAHIRPGEQIQLRAIPA